MDLMGEWLGDAVAEGVACWLERVGHVGVRVWIMLGRDGQACWRRGCIRWSKWFGHVGRNDWEMLG